MASGQLLAGDLVFVRGHLCTPTDDLIKLGEWLRDPNRPLWGMYSHVAISLGGNMLAEAQGGRESGYEMLQAYEDNFDIGRVEWSDADRKAIADEAVKQFGKPYDWWLIGDIAFDDLTGIRIPFHERCRRICSTYVRSVFMGATGVAIPNNTLCTPEDIALDPHVTIEKVV